MNDIQQPPMYPTAPPLVNGPPPTNAPIPVSDYTPEVKTKKSKKDKKDKKEKKEKKERRSMAAASSTSQSPVPIEEQQTPPPPPPSSGGPTPIPPVTVGGIGNTAPFGNSVNSRVDSHICSFNTAANHQAQMPTVAPVHPSLVPGVHPSLQPPPAPPAVQQYPQQPVVLAGGSQEGGFQQHKVSATPTEINDRYGTDVTGMSVASSTGGAGGAGGGNTSAVYEAIASVNREHELRQEEHQGGARGGGQSSARRGSKQSNSVRNSFTIQGNHPAPPPLHQSTSSGGAAIPVPSSPVALPAPVNQAATRGFGPSPTTSGAFVAEQQQPAVTTSQHLKALPPPNAEGIEVHSPEDFPNENPQIRSSTNSLKRSASPDISHLHHHQPHGLPNVVHSSSSPDLRSSSQGAAAGLRASSGSMSAGGGAVTFSMEMNKYYGEEIPFGGKNIVCCGGFIVLGPNIVQMLMAATAITVPVILVEVFMRQAIPLGLEISAVVAYGLTMLSLFRTATTNPGIVAKRKDHADVELKQTITAPPIGLTQEEYDQKMMERQQQEEAQFAAAYAHNNSTVSNNTSFDMHSSRSPEPKHLGADVTSSAAGLPPGAVPTQQSSTVSPAGSVHLRNSMGSVFASAAVMQREARAAAAVGDETATVTPGGPVTEVSSYVPTQPPDTSSNTSNTLVAPGQTSPTEIPSRLATTDGAGAPPPLSPATAARQEEQLQMRQWDIKYCYTCHIMKGPRTMHCRVCNNCVDQFDHHCPWLGTCIGAKNYNSFLYFLGFLNASVLLMMVTVVMAPIIVSQRGSLEDSGDVDEISIWEAMGELYYMPVVLAIYVFLGNGASVLFFYHLWLMKHGMTTAEHLRRVYTADEAHENPFHLGCIGNCYARCTGWVDPDVLSLSYRPQMLEELRKAAEKRRQLGIKD